MKKMTMVKGNSTVTFTQDNTGYYVTVGKNGVPIPVSNYKGLMTVIDQYFGMGFKIKADSIEDDGQPTVHTTKSGKVSTSTTAKATKATTTQKKEKKGPTWNFPGGFDRQKYIEVANTIEGATWVHPVWGIKVKKAFREKVYEAMGATRVR